MGRTTDKRQTKAPHSVAGSLKEELRDLLTRAQPEIQDLRAKLESLERKGGSTIYSEWLHLLGGLRVDPPKAKETWRAVLDHWTDLEKEHGSSVDPRVALVSHFIGRQGEQANSIGVEIHLAEPMRDAADWDELTGLDKARFFSERLEREMRRCERFNQPVSLLMIEVDGLEEYNDRNGRDTGDRALVTIARIIRESLRVDDGKARAGGKELAVTLPATPKIAAGMVAGRLREKVELRYFPGEDHQPGGKLTVSVGVATFPGDARNRPELLRQAQRAMFAATSGGRNQVRLIGEDRRSNQRVEAALGGTFSSWATGDYPKKTLDISEAGIKFSSTESLPPDALVNVCLKIPETELTVEMAVRIVKSDLVRPPEIAWISGVERTVGGRYEIAARTIEISSEGLRILRDHLRTVEDDSSPGG